MSPKRVNCKKNVPSNFAEFQDQVANSLADEHDGGCDGGGVLLLGCCIGRIAISKIITSTDGIETL